MKALIYCRVSSKKQAIEGSGLDSQEHRCRQYADREGFEVEAVFPDDVSGGGDFMKRPGMVALLSYLDAKPETPFVVIFDDLKRFARDTEFYIKLRREFDRREAKIACLNFKFEESPEGRFVETIMAAHGQLEREQNGRQSVQKTRARIEAGYWAFNAPIGYKFERVKPHGNLLVRDEPLASIIQEGLEGYASGRFASQAEVQRFFEGQPAFPKCIKDQGLVRMERVSSILRNGIYAGLVESPKWGITVREGQHEALISFKSHKIIQERMSGAKKAPMRADTSADFPLRGFITCSCCESPLTGSWSKGRMKHYAYYHCHKRGCSQYQKTIPKAKLEGAFEDELKALQPAPRLFKIAATMFARAWDGQAAKAEEATSQIKADIAKLEKQAAQFMDRIVDATSPALVTAYEKRLTAIEDEKTLAKERAAEIAPSQGTFMRLFEPAMILLANPWKIWASGDLDLRRLVLRMAFADRMSYCRDTGVRTTQIAMPFKALASLKTDKCEMVPLKGLEPPTPSLRMRQESTRTIQDHQKHKAIQSSMVVIPPYAVQHDRTPML